MPHVLRMKDGKFITPFDLDDVLEAVEEYAGDEVRQYLEENLSDTADLEKELDGMYREHEEELERQGDHQRALLNEIREEAESLGRAFGCAEAGPKETETDSRKHLADVLPGTVSPGHIRLYSVLFKEGGRR